MKCHFSQRRNVLSNLLLASLGIGEKLLRGETLVMLILCEIFLWLHKHFEERVEFVPPPFPSGLP